jgi:acetyl-CoA acetyltransferase
VAHRVQPHAAGGAHPVHARGAHGPLSRFEHDAIVAGIGQSEVGRRLDRSALSLTVDAVTAAIADAGLSPADVDAVTTYPGGGTALGAGFGGPAAVEVVDALGLDVDALMGNFEGPAQLGPVLNACLMVATGLARHVLVYRTVTEGSARAEAKQAAEMGTGPRGRWITPWGGGPAPLPFALLAQRHFHEHGTTREQLAQVALVARRHAARNPKALHREPLSMDDYLGARMIAEPLCVLDCDVHCDGATAFVVSHPSHAVDAPGPVVHVEALGTAPAGRADHTQQPDLLPGRRAAAQLWSRTDLRPADVDVAGLYDGFSILTLLWLEALGFCGEGESGAFVEGGERIALGGALPLNTDGGQLAGGRLHGLGYLHEVCLQLRGEAGARQVSDAQVGLVAVGAIPYVGCVLLRRG